MSDLINPKQENTNVTSMKGKVESDHSQQHENVPSNKYGDLTNLLHAAEALSQLPNHDISVKPWKENCQSTSVPVSDDDAKTVPASSISITTAQDKVVQHNHVNPPPSYYPPPALPQQNHHSNAISNTNGMIAIPDSHLGQVQQPNEMHLQTYEKMKRPYTNTRHTFPSKLMDILNSDKDFSDIIRWSENGTSFQIIDPTKLCETVLPLYFPGEKVKYPSFTRKLNRWGFRQISRGPDGGAFYHEWFLRDKPEICKDMVCKPSVRKGSYIKSFGTSVVVRQGHTVHQNNIYGYHLSHPMFQQVKAQNQIPFHLHQMPLPLQSRTGIPMPSLKVTSQSETAVEKVAVENVVDKSSCTDV
jgi:hypothetical protein